MSVTLAHNCVHVAKLLDRMRWLVAPQVLAVVSYLMVPKVAATAGIVLLP